MALSRPRSARPPIRLVGDQSLAGRKYDVSGLSGLVAKKVFVAPRNVLCFSLRSVMYGRQQQLLCSTSTDNNYVNLNMNSVKVTTKKTTKSPGTKSAADLSAPATPQPRTAPLNSTVDRKSAPALKPIAAISRPTPTTSNVSIGLAKVKASSAPPPQSFAALAITPPAAPAKAAAVQDKQTPGPKSAASAQRATTTIEAKIDVGFGNAVYLRGQGPGLSWERGVPCECVNRNTWRWTAPRAEKLTFKLLLNDSVWAKGADLVIGPGEKVEIVPAF